MLRFNSSSDLRLAIIPALQACRTKYYTLIVRDGKDTDYAIEFGSYNLSEVEDELEANAGSWPRSDMRIVKTHTANQRIVAEAVAVQNIRF